MTEGDELNLGRNFLQKDKPKDALHMFQREVMKHEGGEMILRSNDLKGLESFSPELLSYYGLCTTLVENRVQVGITLCRAALDADFLRSDFYLNLGRVYLRADQKSKAIEVFRKGIETTDHTLELQKELKKLGVRGTPLITSLLRSNFINKIIGKLLSRSKKGNPRK